MTLANSARRAVNDIQVAGGGDDYAMPQQKAIVINTPAEESIYTVLSKIVDKLSAIELSLICVLIVLVAGGIVWSVQKWRAHRK